MFFSTASREEEKTNTYSTFLEGRHKDKPTKMGRVESDATRSSTCHFGYGNKHPQILVTLVATWRKKIGRVQQCPFSVGFDFALLVSSFFSPLDTVLKTFFFTASSPHDSFLPTAPFPPFATPVPPFASPVLCRCHNSNLLLYLPWTGRRRLRLRLSPTGTSRSH
jgi:hypothetical protein